MTQKEIAIKYLETLDIYEPFIRKFKSIGGIPCFFENFVGFYVDQEPKLQDKIKEVEQQTGCLVYAVTHEIADFGETWSMLCVPQNPDDAEYYVYGLGNNQFYAYSYVWNESTPWFSEFGDIIIKSFGGGIRRVY